jgi:multidrug transporter EmrE-like cation transporter
VCGAVLIKLELQKSALSSFGDYVSFMLRMRVIMGFAVVFLSAIILIKALSLSKISVVNPISTGMNFTLTLFVGYLIFQDKLTVLHYFGMLLILIGIILIASVEQS